MKRRSDEGAEDQNSREAKAVLLALAAVFLWSTVAVAFKMGLEDLHPADLVILSSFVSWFALAFLLLGKRLMGYPKGRTAAGVSFSPDLKNIITAALLGLLNPVVYYLVLFAAYRRLPAQAAQPLNYTWPLFLVLLAAPINRRVPSLRDLLAVAISFIGVILISRRPSAGADALDGLGIVLALGSGIIWALYWLIGNRLKMDGILRLFWGFTFAVAVLFFLWWFRGFPLPGTLRSRGAVIWVGLFEMGITFLFWNGALEHTRRPARIGNLVYLGPFISLIWIRLFLGELIRPSTIAGLLVIVAGILYGQGIFRRHRQSSS